MYIFLRFYPCQCHPPGVNMYMFMRIYIYIYTTTTSDNEKTTRTRMVLSYFSSRSANYHMGFFFSLFARILSCFFAPFSIFLSLAVFLRCPEHLGRRRRINLRERSTINKQENELTSAI